jgi:hypothetical protein
LKALEHIGVKCPVTADSGWAVVAGIAEVIRECSTSFLDKKSNCGQVIGLNTDSVNGYIHCPFSDETVLPEITDPS